MTPIEWLIDFNKAKQIGTSPIFRNAQTSRFERQHMYRAEVGTYFLVTEQWRNDDESDKELTLQTLTESEAIEWAQNRAEY